MYNVHKIQIMYALAQFFICAIANWLRNRSVIIIAHVHSIYDLCAGDAHSVDAFEFSWECSENKNNICERKRDGKSVISRLYHGVGICDCSQKCITYEHVRSMCTYKYNLFYSNSSDTFLENCDCTRINSWRFPRTVFRMISVIKRITCCIEKKKELRSRHKTWDPKSDPYNIRAIKSYASIPHFPQHKSSRLTSLFFFSPSAYFLFLSHISSPFFSIYNKR